MIDESKLKIGMKCRYGMENAPRWQKTGVLVGFTKYRDESTYVFEDEYGRYDFPVFQGEILEIMDKEE